MNSLQIEYLLSIIVKPATTFRAIFLILKR
jgi:hypothetical protein